MCSTPQKANDCISLHRYINWASIKKPLLIILSFIRLLSLSLLHLIVFLAEKMRGVFDHKVTLVETIILSPLAYSNSGPRAPNSPDTTRENRSFTIWEWRIAVFWGFWCSSTNCCMKTLTSSTGSCTSAKYSQWWTNRDCRQDSQVHAMWGRSQDFVLYSEWNLVL